MSTKSYFFQLLLSGLVGTALHAAGEQLKALKKKKAKLKFSRRWWSWKRQTVRKKRAELKFSRWWWSWKRQTAVTKKLKFSRWWWSWKR
jgi:hypothetical protein